MYKNQQLTNLCQQGQHVTREICENKCVDSWWCKQRSHGQISAAMTVQMPGLMQVQTPDVTAEPAIIVAPRKKGRSSGYGK